MPVRARRSRRNAADALTMSRDLALFIGPTDPSEPVAVLERVYRRHRHRYSPSTWAHELFENGHDLAALDQDPVEMTADELPPGCQLNSRVRFESP